MFSGTGLCCCFTYPLPEHVGGQITVSLFLLDTIFQHCILDLALALSVHLLISAASLLSVMISVIYQVFWQHNLKINTPS